MKRIKMFEGYVEDLNNMKNTSIEFINDYFIKYNLEFLLVNIDDDEFSVETINATNVYTNLMILYRISYYLRRLYLYLTIFFYLLVMHLELQLFTLIQITYCSSPF